MRSITRFPTPLHHFTAPSRRSGWADASWHREGPEDEVQTPYLDEMVRTGIELDRHYVYQFCPSPGIPTLLASAPPPPTHTHSAGRSR